MAKRRPKKPMLKFPKRMQKKMIVMFTVVAALMIGLIGRLMYIEYTSGEKYEKIVLAQQGADAGLGAIGGIGDSYWSKNKSRSMEGKLVQVTRILAVAFVVLAVVLNLNF